MRACRNSWSCITLQHTSRHDAVIVAASRRFREDDCGPSSTCCSRRAAPEIAGRRGRARHPGADLEASGRARSAENVGWRASCRRRSRTADCGLGAVWPLWEKRPEARAHLLTDLILPSHHALGIKADERQPMIAPGRSATCARSRALLSDCRARGSCRVYIAPIRHDRRLPMTRASTALEGASANAGSMNHARLLNLESLCHALLGDPARRSD